MRDTAARVQHRHRLAQHSPTTRWSTAAGARSRSTASAASRSRSARPSSVDLRRLEAVRRAIGAGRDAGDRRQRQVGPADLPALLRAGRSLRRATGSRSRSGTTTSSGARRSWRARTSHTGRAGRAALHRRRLRRVHRPRRGALGAARRHAPGRHHRVPAGRPTTAHARRLPVAPHAGDMSQVHVHLSLRAPGTRGARIHPLDQGPLRRTDPRGRRLTSCGRSCPAPARRRPATRWRASRGRSPDAVPRSGIPDEDHRARDAAPRRVRQPALGAPAHRRGPGRPRRDLHGRRRPSRPTCTRRVAPKLARPRPAARSRRSTRALSNYLGWRSAGVETRGNSAIDIALWDLFGKAHGKPVADMLGGRSRDSIRVYNTCAGYKYIRDARAQSVANWHAGRDRRALRGPRRASCTAPTSSRMSLLEQGITGMKIWPFDIAAERSGGYDISPAELRAALEPFAKIRKAVGDRMDIMVEFHSLWSLPMAKKLAQRAGGVRHLLARGPVPARQRRRPARTTRGTARRGSARRETLAYTHSFREYLADRRGRRGDARPVVVRRPHRGTQDRRAWPRPGTCRSRRTTAPGRSSTPRRATCRCTRATR